MKNLTSKISVIFPTFNEQDNIVEAIERVTKTLNNNLLEIIIVDDDSKDKTRLFVENLIKKRKDISLIHRTTIKGLSSAIAEGVNNAKGDIICWLDCDLGIPPEEINNLLLHIEDYDVVIGSRFVENGTDTRKKWIKYSSGLLNYMAQIILSDKVKDYTSGFICLKKEVFKKITISPFGFGEYFIELMYDCIKNDYTIKEVGYIYNDRKSGESKSTSSITRFLILGLSYIKKIILLKFKKYE